MAKKNSDEVRECDITPEEWAGWKIADAEEWEKVASANAVRAMSVEESRDVLEQLKQGGIQDRVLPSRMVRRWKPAELPGEAPSRKSRWCIRGDKDPNLMVLERYAPNSDYSRDCHGSPSSSNERVQVCSRRPQECIHAVRSSFPSTRSTLLQATYRRSFQPTPRAVDRDPGGCIWTGRRPSTLEKIFEEGLS